MVSLVLYALSAAALQSLNSETRLRKFLIKNTCLSCWMLSLCHPVSSLSQAPCLGAWALRFTLGGQTRPLGPAPTPRHCSPAAPPGSRPHLRWERPVCVTLLGHGWRCWHSNVGGRGGASPLKRAAQLRGEEEAERGDPHVRGWLGWAFGQEQRHGRRRSCWRSGHGNVGRKHEACVGF